MLAGKTTPHREAQDNEKKFTWRDGLSRCECLAGGKGPPGHSGGHSCGHRGRYGGCDATERVETGSRLRAETKQNLSASRYLSHCCIHACLHACLHLMCVLGQTSLLL